MTKKINTREIALNILMEVFEKEKLSHISLRDNLDKYSELTKQDRAFITRLAEGTIEKVIQLDYIINCYSKVKVKKMKPAIRNIMRMGVYQIKYMDSVPDSAACNESVRLAVLKGYSGLKGFVNGVLRSYIREPNKGNFSEDNYSVKYSVPQWIIDMWIQSYGQETTLKMLDNAVCDEKITIRQNKSVCSREELIESLTDDGVDVKESDITQEDIRYFQNYLFWKICEIAAELSLPLQCHTGMGQITNTNILQLNDVIKSNPETKFVLLHCGFPWLDDLFPMVDGYQNVYPDLTWVPLLSYTASNRVLHQLIEMSQIDKICWGCDTWTVEESYGSLLAFRFSLCRVLTEKIEDGYLSVSNAKDIIDKILFDNAGKLYL